MVQFTLNFGNCNIDKQNKNRNRFEILTQIDSTFCYDGLNTIMIGKIKEVKTCL